MDKTELVNIMIATEESKVAQAYQIFSKINSYGCVIGAAIMLCGITIMFVNLIRKRKKYIKESINLIVTGISICILGTLINFVYNFEFSSYITKPSYGYVLLIGYLIMICTVNVIINQKR